MFKGFKKFFANDISIDLETTNITKNIQTIRPLKDGVINKFFTPIHKY